MALLLSYENETPNRRLQKEEAFMKRKKKRAKPKLCDPAICSHCTYIGDGDFICDNHPDEAVVMVLSDWEPTEHFLHCAQAITAPKGSEVASQ